MECNSRIQEGNGQSSASDVGNSDDAKTLVFPKDFVVEREDIPIVGGLREGSGKILYRAANHPEWSVYELRGNWIDDEIHGKASLYHNTHLLFTASYVYGVMYFKREKCDGVIISPSGCKPIRTYQPPKTSTKYIKSVHSETNPEAPAAPEEVKEMHEKEEYSDESEEYEDDETFCDGNNQEQMEMYWMIAKNMLTNKIPTDYYYNKKKKNKFLFLLSKFKTENYMMVIPVKKGVLNGVGLLYSMRTIEALCHIQFQSGVPTQCFLMKMDKKEREYDAETLDMNDEGERWEGEVRDLLPNGQGKFFNTDNVCIYDGMMVNGKAHGIGTGFYPDLETIAYYGIWRNNMRHGPGMEFNRKGEFMRSGLWLFGRHVEMKRLEKNLVSNTAPKSRTLRWYNAFSEEESLYS